jgi:DNA-binding transcriptional regulator YiaG
MKITTRHPSSHYGVPVILDDAGKPMDYRPGVKAARERLGLSLEALGAACGVSGRTVMGWEYGRPVPAAALNVLADLLADHP